MSRSNPGVVDFPNVMSKFLMFGMPLSQVIACATVGAARVFPAFNDRGTLNVGAPADVAVLEFKEGTFEFIDNYKGTRNGTRDSSRSPPCSRARQRRARSKPGRHSGAAARRNPESEEPEHGAAGFRVRAEERAPE